MTSWKDLGIEDPGIAWPKAVKYTDEAIAAETPRPYKFEQDTISWNKMRKHPGFIELVRTMILDVSGQIEDIKLNAADKETMKQKIHRFTKEFMRLMEVGNKIAEDIGWEEGPDVVIAAQHHPFVLDLIKKRNVLFDMRYNSKKRRK